MYDVAARAALTVEIRPLQDSDQLGDVVAVLLRSAVDPSGRPYRAIISATVDDLAKAVVGGTCLVAIEQRWIVGAGIYHRSSRLTGSAYMRQPHVASVTQLAVDPLFRRRGIGATLLARAEALARDDGATELAAATPDFAVDTMDFLERRGYRIVEESDATQPAFVTVVFSRWLGAAR